MENKSLFLNKSFCIKYIDLNYNDILELTNKSIVDFSIDELVSLCMNDEEFAMDLFYYIYSHKDNIKNIVSHIFDNDKNNYKQSLMFMYIMSILEIKKALKFIIFIRNEEAKELFRIFIELLFICKDDLDNKYKEVSLFLENEKNILDEETYREALKKEFINEIKNL